jgi:putative oxidoreductase
VARASYPYRGVIQEQSERDDMKIALAQKRHGWPEKKGTWKPVPLPSAGLLVLRLVVGVTFLLHGIDKLGDMSGAEQFFASLDIPAPGLMAPFVAVTETAGGVLLIVGAVTPLVGAALAADMLVALVTAHLGHGFFVSDGGFELELLLGGACLTFVLAGAGRFSVDATLGLFRLPPQAISREAGL